MLLAGSCLAPYSPARPARINGATAKPRHHDHSHPQADRHVRAVRLVIVWSLLAMAIAQFPSIFGNPVACELYYVVAGIGWVLPAMPLVRWMSKASPSRR